MDRDAVSFGRLNGRCVSPTGWGGRLPGRSFEPWVEATREVSAFVDFAGFEVDSFER
jgi:hypothetical protein